MTVSILLFFSFLQKKKKSEISQLVMHSDRGLSRKSRTLLESTDMKRKELSVAKLSNRARTAMVRGVTKNTVHSNRVSQRWENLQEKQPSLKHSINQNFVVKSLEVNLDFKYYLGKTRHC